MDCFQLSKEGMKGEVPHESMCLIRNYEILGFYSKQARRDSYFSAINSSYQGGCVVFTSKREQNSMHSGHMNSIHIAHALPSTDHCRDTTSRWTDCEG